MTDILFCFWNFRIGAWPVDDDLMKKSILEVDTEGATGSGNSDTEAGKEEKKENGQNGANKEEQKANNVNDDPNNLNGANNLPKKRKRTSTILSFVFVVKNS